MDFFLSQLYGNGETDLISCLVPGWRTCRVSCEVYVLEYHQEGGDSHDD